jgi:Fe-S-cluster containining protein
MRITVHDITSEVCQRCAACCRKIEVVVNGDERYRKYLEAIGYPVKTIGPSPQGRNKLAVELGCCKHLEEKDGRYKCKIYETRPQLCQDYNCVAWALPPNKVDESELCKKAIATIEGMKENELVVEGINE